MSCDVEGCSLPSVKGSVGGLCAGHVKRRQRYPGDFRKQRAPLREGRGGIAGKPLEPMQRLAAAALAYADAESDDDFARARENLMDAAEWFALGIPKTLRAQSLGYALLAELRIRSAAADLRELGAVLRFPRPSPRRPSLLAG